MIEISHHQARILIRLAIDRPLPDEQWSALQAHLESCGECRAYQRGYANTERGLRRTLHHRWSSVNGPTQSAWDALVRRKAIRAQVQTWLKRGAIGAGVIALLVLWGVWQRYQSTRVVENRLRPGTAVTPTPAITFRGVVAYTEAKDGRTRTVLLTARGGEKAVTISDLIPGSTQNEAAPAWSPDGEWLAFLQGQAGGKPELYIIHVSGTRLTPLTSDPNIAWSGPLSWSSDGKYIALTGTRTDQGNSRWVYLAALDGSGVRALAGTRRAASAARFAAGQPVLAFSDVWGNLNVYNTEADHIAIVATSDSKLAEEGDGNEQNFDWLPGGHALTYLHTAPSGLQLRLSGDVNPGNYATLNEGTIVEELVDHTSLRSVSWVPNNLLVATLYRNTPDCWVVRLNDTSRLTKMARNLTGLCIASHLGPEHWTPDGDWLVAWARTPEEVRKGAPAAPYALRIPGSLDAAANVYFEKLADISSPPGGAGLLDGDDHLPDLAVRPQSVLQMQLAPRPVSPYQSPMPISRPSADAGSLIYTRVMPDGSFSLMASGADGSDIHPLIDAVGGSTESSTASGSGTASESISNPVSISAFCPAISPDKTRLAYVKIDPTSPLSAQIQQSLQAVVLADADGQNAQVLFDLSVAPEASSAGVYRQFGCPVWSPNGKWIVSVLYDGEETSLAVAFVDPSAATVHFRKVGRISNRMQPRWTPDGKRVLLAYPDDAITGQNAVHLAALDPFGESPGEVHAPTELLKTFGGWNDIGSLEYSPDGSEAALVLISTSNPQVSGSNFAQLVIVRTDHWDISSAPTYNIASSGSAIIHWLPYRRVALVTRSGPSDRSRSYLLVYDPGNLMTTTILSFGDTIANTSWSPDGRWVAFTAESGLWGLDAGAIMMKRPASPFLVDSDAGWQVEWK